MDAIPVVRSLIGPLVGVVLRPDLVLIGSFFRRVVLWGRGTAPFRFNIKKTIYKLQNL